MRKLLLLLFALFIAGIGFGQNVQRAFNANTGGIEAGDHYTSTPHQFVAIPGDPNTDILQLWALPTTGATSGNTRCPGNTFNYQRTEYLITPAEMAASGFPSGVAVEGIGFLVNTAGLTSQTGNFKVYLKNTSDATYTLGATWTTAGFTLASDIAAWAVPIAAGPYTVNFSGGSTFTYTGGGVYVAWEFSNPGTIGTTALVGECNNSLANSLYGQRSNTALPTTLAVSAFRPATIFLNNSLTDILSVDNIYAYEKDPIPYGTPNKVGIRVSNLSAAPATFNLTLTVNSTPPYTITQTSVTLAANTSTTYDFTGWMPTVLGTYNVTGSVTAAAGETFTTNNTQTIPVIVNNNLFSYSYDATTAGSAYGFTYPATGLWLNKFHMTGAGTVSGANIYIFSSATPANTGIGNTVYAVVVNSAGVTVATSADMILAAGNVNMLDLFTFPTPPAFLNEDFYVGLYQSAGTAQWFPMGYQNEAPNRVGAFYEWTTGGTLAEANLDVKFIIEALIGAGALPAHDVGTISIDMGQVVSTGVMTPKATVKNFGSNTESFNVTMTIGAYTSTKSVSSLASGATVQVNFDAWTAVLGDYSVNVCTALTGDLVPANDCKTQAVKVLNLNKQVYAYLAFKGTGTDPVGPTSFNLSTPGTLNSIADQTGQLGIFGGTWAMDTWYGTVYNTVAPYNFVTISPTTGARTVIGDMGMTMNGLSYNTATGIMYAVAYNSTTSASELYTINMTTGVPTLVGSAAGVLLINLAINNAGVCYSVDISADNLGTVDLATGAFTIIGPVGFDASYAQDMEFNRETGELYMAAYGSAGFLAWVNKTTGATLKIGDFEGGGEVTGFAIPYTFVQPNITVTGTVTGEESNCYSASNTITVGPFTLQAGGTAIFKAGVKISFIPGTTIQNGGNMHGFITIEPCIGGAKMPAIAGVDPQVNIERAYFTLFPNPTTGNFTLVQRGDKLYGNVTVEIYSINGNRMMNETMIGEKQHEVITTSLPAGIYFIKLIADDYTETIKLIKTR